MCGGAKAVASFNLRAGCAVPTLTDLGNGVTALQVKAEIRDFAASPGNYTRMKAFGVLIGMQQTFEGRLGGPANLTSRHKLGQTGWPTSCSTYTYVEPFMGSELVCDHDSCGFT